MIKSRENAKKPVFPAYFWHFQPEIFFFRKSGSVTFWTLSFCVSVRNCMKKYQVQLEILKKYCFSGENWLFWLQKSVFLTIETCLMVGIAVNNVFVWKNNQIWRKNWTKSGNTISGIFPAFSAGKIFFSKIELRHFWVSPFCIIVQKIRKN